jgi:hypothetical protein
MEPAFGRGWGEESDVPDLNLFVRLQRSPAAWARYASLVREADASLHGSRAQAELAEFVTRFGSDEGAARAIEELETAQTRAEES